MQTHQPEHVQRLSIDLREAAATLSDDEARYLVDAYYLIQEDRKRTTAQERALDTSDEPHRLLTWFADQNRILEQQIQRALDEYTKKHLIGDWMRGIYGIGPVIASGLLANIYMGRWCSTCRARTEQEHDARVKKDKQPHLYSPIPATPTVGHIWAFAGLAADGQKPWERNTKRPWNHVLKVLCWKAGDCFVKFSNAPDCYYGHIYRERKLKEVAKNESGQLRHIAEQRLARAKKSVEAPYHEQGKLSPGHLDLRARRYAVKLFLAHLHGEWWQRVYGTPPPLPYPIAMLGHAHLIPPPH